MELFLWIGGGIIIFNVVIMVILALFNIENDRRWKDEYSRKRRKPDQ